MALERQLMYVDFGKGPAEPVHLTPLGEGKYRVEDVFDLILDEYGQEVEVLRYHDVIEGEEIGKGRLRFVGVVQRSSLEHLQYLIPRDLYESAEMRPLWRWLHEQGGASQLLMRGLLSVSTPKAAKARFISEFDRIWELYQRARPAADPSQGN